MSTEDAAATVFVWSTRLSKATGKPVRELLEMSAADAPPGARFPSRHAAKQHGRRDAAARPLWCSARDIVSPAPIGAG